LAVSSSVSGGDTAVTAAAYHVAGVFAGTDTNAAIAKADHVGNIRVEASEIYIYV
jgi:hypothetical protein